ncbi:MAG TPA: alpha/beta hydrolase [Beijerinckiaceae bacterium]|nr:alpha/beta hydrolase [Beijerinckiaceae bacterium]
MPSPQIRVRFATNRNPVRGRSLFGNQFRDDGPAHYVTGSVDVARLSNLPDTGWSPDTQSLEIDKPVERLADVATAPAGGAGAGATPARGILKFAEERMASEERDVFAAGGAQFGLVLLPGFASTFLDSMRRAAQVAHAYGTDNVFCFSWPANGVVDLDNYRLDRDDAKASAPAMANALAQLFALLQRVEEGRRPKLHLVAHSMGVFALRHAVQQIRAEQPQLIEQRVFHTALLMAGDEDDDALADENRLRPLLKLAHRVAIYCCGSDIPLGISQGLGAIGARLGHRGPRAWDHLPDEGVELVDCSDVATTHDDFGRTHFGHQYYRLSPRVVSDVVQVLAGRAPRQIGGRMPDPRGSQDGRAFLLPFNAEAGVPIA